LDQAGRLAPAAKLKMRTAERHTQEAAAAAGTLRLALWDFSASTCQLPVWQRQALQPASCSINIVAFDGSRLLDETTRLDEQSKLFPMLDTALLFNQAPILLTPSCTDQSAESALESCLHAYPNFDSLQERLWLPSTGLFHLPSDPSFRSMLSHALQAHPHTTTVSACDLALIDPLLFKLHIESNALYLPMSECHEMAAKAAIKSPAAAVKAVQLVLNATCLGTFTNSPVDPLTDGVVMRPSDLEDVFALINQQELENMVLPRKAAKCWAAKRHVTLAMLHKHSPLDDDYDDSYSWDELVDTLYHLKLAKIVKLRKGGDHLFQLQPPLVAHTPVKLPKLKRVVHCSWQPSLGRGHAIIGPLLDDVLGLVANELLRNAQQDHAKSLRTQPKRWSWNVADGQVDVRLPCEGGIVGVDLGAAGLDVMLAGKHVDVQQMQGTLSQALQAMGCDVQLAGPVEQQERALVRTVASAWGLKDEVIV
jgi:hypothetical protein